MIAALLMVAVCVAGDAAGNCTEYDSETLQSWNGPTASELAYCATQAAQYRGNDRPADCVIVPADVRPAVGRPLQKPTRLTF